MASPFFRLAPSWATLPLFVLATLATVIASQAVTSGAYSVSRQAVRLGMLPRMLVRHTSREEGGQIYVPVMSWILFVGVVLLIAVFRSSSRLATAYGLAATGTLLLTSALFLVLAQEVWRVERWKILTYVVLVVALEVTFLVANLAKIVSGGWPLLIAAGVIALMTTWRRGAIALHEKERYLEGPLPAFIKIIRDHDIPRVPGVAVFPHPNATTTPLALRRSASTRRCTTTRPTARRSSTCPRTAAVRRAAASRGGCPYAANDKREERRHRLPLSTYSARGGLRQDPGRGADSTAEGQEPAGLLAGNCPNVFDPATQADPRATGRNAAARSELMT